MRYDPSNEGLLLHGMNADDLIRYMVLSDHKFKTYCVPGTIYLCTKYPLINAPAKDPQDENARNRLVIVYDTRNHHRKVALCNQNRQRFFEEGKKTWTKQTKIYAHR